MNPIDFNSAMVCALLAGTKTQTRRIVTPEPEKHNKLWHWKNTAWCEGRALVSDSAPIDVCPWGHPGDTLWVKERLIAFHDCGADVVAYKADEVFVEPLLPWKWKESHLRARFCPRIASRITLAITSVRMERVSDITEADALAEGVTLQAGDCGAVGAFERLWKDIHGERSWTRDPWVWVLTFEVCK